MMPKLLLVLMIVFGLVLVLSAGQSQPSRDDRLERRRPCAAGRADRRPGDLGLPVLGFIVTMTLLVFTLLIAVERKNVLHAAAYSIGLTGVAWWCSALRSVAARNRNSWF